MLALACNSDLYLEETTTTTTSTSGPITTDPPPPWDFTTSGTTGTTGPVGTLSCRSALSCLIQCALNIPQPPGPEPDLSCFLECEDGLSAEEVYDLFKFVNCVSNLCIDNGSCDPNDFGGDACTGCFIENLALDAPPGCEAEGMACKAQL
ncbi:MAG: hypothetical protein R3B09_12245 [Nannocystaceae bacterium]